MALRGTLKDFGIADIFQLIGHQTKTGTLLLKSRESEVKISFREGSVVRVESSTRQKKDLLGHMLVRAEIISEAQLEEALENQKRTLRRLGDVLVSGNVIAAAQLTTFTRLQATETIYRLFTWQNGTYEFSQTEVQSDPDFGEPMRAESVLMEGFRMVDEWPAIRKRITGYGMCFEQAKSLPAEAAPVGGGDDVDDAFDMMGEGTTSSKPAEVGASERRVYALVEPSRDVQKIIDLSHLGEFETCKALSELLGQGYIQARGGEKKSVNPPLFTGGLTRRSTFLPSLIWGVVAAGLAAALVAVLVTVQASPRAMLPAAVNLKVPAAVKMVLVLAQRDRLALALEAFKLDEGRYPSELQALVKKGYLEPIDLEFPTGRPFIYQSQGEGFVLAPPVP